MKELIYVTGKIDFSFFENEIVVMRKYFDSVYVLAYGNENRTRCDELSKQYKFDYDFVMEKGKNVKHLTKTLASIHEKYVQDEFSLIKKKKLSKKNYLYVLYYLWFSSTANELIRKRMKPGKDIYLYSFWLSRPAFSIAQFNINRDKSIKSIVSRTHRYDLYEEENQYKYLPFRQFISRNLDSIYFTSRDSLNYFSEKNYSGDTHAQYILSYLGTQDFKIKKDIDVNKKSLVYASCSNMIQRKRLDLIIDFLSSEALQGINITWVCIGDGELWEQVKAKANETLKNVNCIFTGRVEEKEIYEIYKQYDVDYFINLSDSEGIPVSIMEAISMGIPAIARNVGGNADIINENDGFLINKEEISKASLNVLAARTVSTFNNKNEYIQMSKKACDMWQERFSTDKNTGRLCEEIIENSNKFGG
jgi:glycosyltransferase involved in cell wall biosynthesis